LTLVKHGSFPKAESHTYPRDLFEAEARQLGIEAENNDDRELVSNRWQDG